MALGIHKFGKSSEKKAKTSVILYKKIWFYGKLNVSSIRGENSEESKSFKIFNFNMYADGVFFHFR